MCKAHSIVMEAYAPLGASGWKQADEPTVLQDETLRRIGEKYGKTIAQVALRWAIQRGTVPLPKSTKPGISFIPADFGP